MVCQPYGRLWEYKPEVKEVPVLKELTVLQGGKAFK